MGEWVNPSAIPEKYSDCVLRKESRTGWGDKRIYCHGLHEVMCATGKCPFYGSNRNLYIRKADGYVCRKEW